jgi:hypothetical protein
MSDDPDPPQHETPLWMMGIISVAIGLALYGLGYVMLNHVLN